MNELGLSLKLNWTYPNMGVFYSEKPPLRGTFNERLEKAKKFGISRIEIPFDLVRLENEEYYLLNKKKLETSQKEKTLKVSTTPVAIIPVSIFYIQTRS